MKMVLHMHIWQTFKRFERSNRSLEFLNGKKNYLQKDLVVDRSLNDTTYAPYTDFIWALHDNADLRIPHDTASSCDKVSFVDVFSQ